MERMPPAVVKRPVVKEPRGLPPYRVWVLLLLGGLLWLGLIGPARLWAADGADIYTVIRVYDGDTILVEGAGGRKLVRLLGIDAPETSKGKGAPGQPYSRKAQRHLAALTLNRTVTLSEHGEDRYKRTLAVVFCGGLDVNRSMLQAGLAEVYRGRTPESFDKAPYLTSETEARESRVGMWRQGADYVSPIRWKHPR